jgi:V8-like Glu-specific endopeptidase
VFSRKLVTAAVVAALGLGVPAIALAIGLRAASNAQASGSRVPTSSTSTSVREIGALFMNASSTQHFCTASVIDSPHGDVLVTAAHCVSASGSVMVFAPGYHDGVSPYGRWTVTGIHLAPGWLRSRDPHDDFAFLTVRRQRVHGRLEAIEQVTGAYQLGDVPRSGTAVTVTGYAAGSDDKPISCQTKVFFTGDYPTFDCRGYVDGTSGSPWLVQTAGTSRVVGLIGGKNQGGCVDSRSYSPPLTQDARQAYVRASDHDASDVAPGPSGNGCS